MSSYVDTLVVLKKEKDLSEIINTTNDFIKSQNGKLKAEIIFFNDLMDEEREPVYTDDNITSEAALSLITNHASGGSTDFLIFETDLFITWYCAEPFLCNAISISISRRYFLKRDAESWNYFFKMFHECLTARRTISSVELFSENKVDKLIEYCLSDYQDKKFDFEIISY